MQSTSRCLTCFVCVFLLTLGTNIWVMDLVKFSLMFFTVKGLPTIEEYRFMDKNTMFEEYLVTDGNTLVVYEIDKLGNLRCSVLANGTEKPEAKNASAQFVTSNMIDRLLTRCKSSQTPHRTRRAIMFPGTKWCGDGDSAANNSDLGEYRDTDGCCRDHDLCDIYIPGFSHRYGLSNMYPFSRMSCDCDTKFYWCLKDINDSVSGHVGSLYFNFIRPTCLIPTNKSRCVYSSMWSWLTSRCDETQLDMQWSSFNSTF
ncbi:phospholipase A(2)-like [Gigantopelta aegis]|uniref:phospholipase A(2)-like n=1 Tax=Gigantopelta aegis TaxID=1735272 RepID=UPI001B88B505|nr:phospholipase A(2)-like [Gigantopelta aegis]